MGAITVPSGASSADADRLDAATHTTAKTLVFSHILLAEFILVCLFFAILSLPYTLFRMQHLGFLQGWSLSSRAVNKPLPQHPTGFTDPPLRLPRRIGRLPLPLPTYIIPHLSLSVPQAVMLLLATISVLAVSFTDSHWLYDSTRTGYVAITLVPCVLLLGVKVLGAGTLLQTGYAAVNWAHRWLGRLLFLIATIHTIAYFIIFAQTHSMHEEMSKTKNVMATIAYAGFVLIFFSSLGPVRRRFFSIFKICHHLGVFLFIVGLDYHSTMFRPWIITSLIIVGVSALLRMATSRLHIAYVTALPSSKSTVITIPGVRSGWIPGQSVRIRVLSGGMGLGAIWEGHPFTLASAPSHNNTEGAKLIVKAAGDWTNKLFAVAQKKGEKFADQESRGLGPAGMGFPVAVLIEGPYGGSNLVYSGFGSVMLAAGGSGVSFLLGVASGIVADCRAGRSCTRELHLVWSVRDRAAVNDLMPHFEAILESAQSVSKLRVTITLYFTSASRALVIRPFSMMPNGTLLTGAGVGKTPRASVKPTPRSQATRKPSPLGMSMTTPNTSTSELLGPGNSSVVSLNDDTVQFAVGDDVEKPTLDDEDLSIEGDLEKEASLSRSSSSASDRTLRSPAIEVRPGRPEYGNILQEVIEREQARFRRLTDFSVKHPSFLAGAGRVAVGACGPQGMVLNLRRMCWDAQGVEFHAEEFSL